MSDRHHPSQRRAVWPPETGYFRLRFVRGAWAVPARITCEDGLWQATIDGDDRQADADPAVAPGVADVWHGGTMIDAVTYAWLLAMKDWALANEPKHPCLHPREAINPAQLKPHFAPPRETP